MKSLLLYTLALLPMTAVFGEETKPLTKLLSPATSGWYFGGGVARSDIYITSISGHELDNSSSGSGFTVNGGYRFNGGVAFELSYLDGGEQNYSNDYFENPDNDFEADVSITAIQASGLLIWPFYEGFEVYGRLGAAYWDADSEQRIIPKDGGPTLTTQLTESDVGLLIGAGLGVDIGDHWHLRAELQDIDIGDNLLLADVNTDANMESWIIELDYRFGDGWK